MGDVQSVTTFDDYEDMGNGIIFAKTMKQSAMGMDQVIEINEVDLEAEIPEDAFALPEEVEALLNK